MAPLIIPGVCRYTVHGTYQGVNIANVLDMHLVTGGGSERNDAVLDQAKVIVSNWADLVCPRVVEQYGATAVSWVDMNSSTGSTGSVTEGTGSSFPANGEITGSEMPGMVSFLIKKNITAGRGARQGRMFLCGVPEAATIDGSGNSVHATYLADTTSAMGDFLSGINQSAGIIGTGSYDSDLVVVHTTNSGTTADPVISYVSRSHVNSLTCDPKVHAQRRRMG